MSPAGLRRLLSPLIAAAAAAPLLLVDGCATLAGGGPPVVEVASGRVLTMPEVQARLAGARVVLLGEMHDNAVHHRTRGALVQALAAQGPLRLVFEQFDRERQPQLAAWSATARAAAADRAAREADVAALLEAGAFDRAAWEWPMHRPVIEAALAPGVQVVAGNLSRESARAVMRRGEAAVPPDLAPVLGAARWDAGASQALEADLVDGHCGQLPDAMRRPMALAQRVRDAALAAALLPVPDGGRTVLIAGNGHVRRDFGVPRYLPASAGPVLAVGFVESDGGVPDRAALAELAGLYDLAFLTPTAPRKDPCAGFTLPRR